MTQIGDRYFGSFLFLEKVHYSVMNFAPAGFGGRGQFMRKGGNRGAELAEMQEESADMAANSAAAPKTPAPRIRNNFVETWLWTDSVVG